MGEWGSGDDYSKYWEEFHKEDRDKEEAKRNGQTLEEYRREEERRRAKIEEQIYGRRNR